MKIRRASRKTPGRLWLQVAFSSPDLSFPVCKVGMGVGPNGFFEAGQFCQSRSDSAAKERPRCPTLRNLGAVAGMSYSRVAPT